MAFVVASLVLVSTVCALDLVLTLGVIRRLRQHGELLAGAPGKPDGETRDVMLLAGERPADFTATTTEGVLVSRDTLIGGTIVGFFTAHCQPCQERVPQFLEQAISLPAGRDQSLAVVIGDDTATKELAESMSTTVRVVLEQSGDPVATAFGVRGYPALCVLDERGVIEASGFSFGQIRSGIKV
jgi:peroxiredoxin